jgi:ferric-dicitrate binding protein FerR (iron transport regulator)
MNTAKDMQVFLDILARYERAEATEAEKAFVEEYFRQLESAQGLLQDIPEAEKNEIRQDLLGRIHDTLRQPAYPAPVHRVHFLKRMRWVAAAVFVLAVAGTWYLVNKKETKPGLASREEQFKNDATPARQGAILRLANGAIINLDTAKNGLLAKGFNKTAGGLTVGTDDIQSTTVETPKGRTINLTLADGTVVWLNAGSSITFPSRFAGTERNVAMTGEAYFQVTHNKKAPFRVHVAGQVIEDLGTEFNVNAYSDEPSLSTTLVSGLVSIGGQVLKPGEQLKGHQITRPDIAEVIAWKNGLFKFSGASTDMVMRQLEKWYDVEVKYEAGIPDHAFAGTVPRDYDLSEVLKMLEASDVHFRIEGKQLIVLP